jgi:Fe-S cluster biogenesis protein NfuA
MVPERTICASANAKRDDPRGRVRPHLIPLEHMARVQGSGAVAAAAVESGGSAEQSLEAKAKHLLDTVVRPLIEADGGQIELVAVTEARMVVRLSGTCLGCPGRPYTLRGVVERAARQHLFPDIQVAADDE